MANKEEKFYAVYESPINKYYPPEVVFNSIPDAMEWIRDRLFGSSQTIQELHEGDYTGDYFLYEIKPLKYKINLSPTVEVIDD